MKEILSVVVLFSGWFYDQTKSYVVSFLVVAGIQFAAAIITGLEIALLSDDKTWINSSQVQRLKKSIPLMLLS